MPCPYLDKFVVIMFLTRCRLCLAWHLRLVGGYLHSLAKVFIALPLEKVGNSVAVALLVEPVPLFGWSRPRSIVVRVGSLTSLAGLRFVVILS
jgi:hypothetical protein